MKNLFDLSGKAAVITGGNGGIGLAIAQALVEAGCAVSIWGRNPEKTKNAEQTLRNLGGKVHAAICDVTDRDAVETAFAEAIEKFGRIDGCIANAGIGGYVMLCSSIHYTRLLYSSITV
ncbi:MAG: SDR family NAD(P)-dependent oxidoreductase [Gammaproteobacteria bacterium]|nr:SDR family NAD(P)-dependent oxidoreductase [Gammaproteobacteria bacterium]